MDNTDKLLLLQSLMEIKASEIELNAKKLRSLLMQNAAGGITEEVFKGEVSEIMHQVGMIESSQGSVWKQYCDDISLSGYFESEKTIFHQS
jgi:hypothetical protein